MSYVRRLALGRVAVHVIDAEADSVAHFRAWAKRGHLFLVREWKGMCAVLHAGQKRKFHEVVRQLQGRFVPSREVLFHGRPGQLFVAQTEVALYRPAKPQRQGRDGPWPKLQGPALTLRLVVSQVRDAAGRLLAEWLLLTNVPADVAAATVALWYYWRWRIESYFKLLEGAGQQVEHWQQETAEALTRRLLVASMACVLVWRVSRQPGPEGESLREPAGAVERPLGQAGAALDAARPAGRLVGPVGDGGRIGGLHDRATACRGAYRPGRERRPQHEEQTDGPRIASVEHLCRN